jgi:hypothetical protein
LIAIDRTFFGLVSRSHVHLQSGIHDRQAGDSDQLTSASLPLFSLEKLEIAKQSGQACGTGAAIDSGA